MNKPTLNASCALATPQRIVCNPTESPAAQSQRPDLRFSWSRSFRGLWSVALLLLLLCGSTSAQVVKVLNRISGVHNLTAPDICSVTGLDLNDSTTVLVVGLYGDGGPDAAGYRNLSFGGVPPTVLINSTNVNGANNTRSAIAYWIGPNTAGAQDLTWNYTQGFAGYYWIYELSSVNTNAPVVATGLTMANSSTTSLTTLTNKSLVISYFSGNNNVAANINALTPNPPLIQDGVTIVNAPAGASMAAAMYTPTLAELVNISWNIGGGLNLGNRGLGALAFQPVNVGAPIVAGSIAPDVAAAGGDYIVTVTLDPFRYGTVTNVNINLTSIGGGALNALVQTANTNVYTNTFVVPGGAPLGTFALPITVQQDAAPYTGTNPVNITIAAPTAPVLVRDTRPAGTINMYIGQGLTFSALFSAPGFVSYNWQKSLDGVTYNDIGGATDPKYTISSAVLGDAAFYRLKCSNFLGTEYSTPVQVLVAIPSPGSIIWSAPISFRGLTAEQILNDFPAANKIAGALMAQNGGNPVTVTLANAGNRQIVFAPANTSWAQLSGGTAYILNVNTNTTGNANFDGVLNRAYNNTALSHNITLTNLEVGQQYQVQLFALDNRQGLTPAGDLQFTAFADPFDSFGITSSPFAMADSAYQLGTFTATSPQQTIQQNLPDSVGNFNALVLRTVGWTNAPYFTIQPRDTNFFAGGRVALSGTAATDSTVSSTVTYQWASGPIGGPWNTDLANGAKYAGVTTTTLIVSNLVAGDAALGYVLKATAGGKTGLSRETRIFVQSQPPTSPGASFAGAVLALTNNPNNLLSGFWRLNETEDPSTGTLLAQDASGKGRNGIYGVTSQNKFNSILSPQPPPYNGFSSGQGALQTGTAGTSDGTSTIRLPALNTTASAAMTIVMWINPSGIAGNLSGLVYNRGAVQGGFGFAGNQGGPSNQRNLGYFWPTVNSAQTFNYNTGLFPVNDIWNLVALVIQSNSASFYLDYVDGNGAAFFGKAVDPAANTYAMNTFAGDGPIWIGGDPNNNGANTVFPGRISSVAIFNSALNDDQIYDLFVAGFQNAGFPASLVQQPPANTTNYVGSRMQLSAVVGGTKPITNQWKFNGNNLVDGYSNGSLIVGSKSNVLTIYRVSAAHQGVYTLAVTNFLGGALSADANVYIETPQPPPGANLIGRWFDGSESLNDLSGHLPGSRHRAYGVGAQGTNYVFTNNVPPGFTGKSLRLSGGTSMGITNSWISDGDYATTFDDEISISFSVMAWARGQPAAWNPFVSKWGENGEGWQLRRSAGQNAVFTLRGTGSTDDPAGTAGGSGADGAWHFYVGTFDANTATRTLYVDGAVQNVTVGGGLYTLSPGARLVLGGRSISATTNSLIDGGANFTGGNLYDVRIYNVALTGPEQAYLIPPSTFPPQTITASPSGSPGQFQLSWVNGGLLLQSTNISGPWVTNLAATPPFTVFTTNVPGQYYRVFLP